ncbi:MAG: FAD binding domain-containing protein [Sciscionella sp.]
MEFLRPCSLAEALEHKAAYPEAVPIAGGTDVMVELNFDHRRPPQLLDLGRVDELARWRIEGERVVLGATVPYARIIGELGRELPGLAMASRTIGSPQIRNRGTVGGNLGAASPAGDAHPMLLACDARIELASVRGVRQLPAADFYLGVKRSAAAPDELITGVLLPRADGPQQFAKVGTRNAMVIAVCSFGLDLRPGRREVGAAVGSAAPVPRYAGAAAEFAAAELPWDAPVPLVDSTLRRFGELAAAAADPIDDVRGSAAYRKHAIGVLARRTLNWAWTAQLNREGEAQCA